MKIWEDLEKSRAYFPSSRVYLIQSRMPGLSGEIAEKLNMKRKWRILGSAAAGVDPRIMGIGPIPAIKKLLKSFASFSADIHYPF